MRLSLPSAQVISVGPQDALLIDDGKGTATVVLRNVANAGAGVTARLIVKSAAAKGVRSQVFQLAAVTSAFDRAQETLTLTFPSPSKLGVKSLALTGNRVVLSLRRCDPQQTLCPRFDDGTAREIERTVRPVTAETRAEAAQAGAPFNIAARSPVVVPGPDGVGTVVLVASKIPAGAKLLIDVAGADVAAAADANNAALPQEDGNFAIIANGRYAFKLFNLTRDSPVTFTAEGQKGDTKLGTDTAKVRVGQ
jgi:hypothetical protein